MSGNLANLLMICIDQNADWPYGVEQGFGRVAVQKIVYNLEFDDDDDCFEVENLEFYSVHKLNVI